MRRLCMRVSLLLSATIFFSLHATGQDFSRAEIFGGYSYLHLDTRGTTSSTVNNQCNIILGGTCPVTFGIHPGFNGWNVAPQVNLNRWLGIKGQISGGYGNLVTLKFNSPLPIPFSIPSQLIYDVLFGPVISHRSDRYTVFGHGLIGIQHVGFAGSVATGFGSISGPSETDLAFALGGGLDVKASKHFAIRVAQFDYEYVNARGAGHQDDFRFSAGVVFGFGGK